ncbi:excinuclease ABC subunit UvrC [Patescibacteria group bacterium]|nr:excinuclease ABC subunit UvrC [Patescibacteria group bacterium]
MPIPSPIRLPKNGLPDTPGVYLMKDASGTIIYVGKATNLKRRVASYWREQEVISRPQVRDLIREVVSISVVQTPTVIEALIHEANTIKQYEPKYNIMLKDGKSFLYLVITKEEYPRPLLIRRHELEKTGESRYKAVFGPYINPTALRAALKLIRRIFPWSTCLPDQKRSCFEYHLRICPGVCIRAISPREYARIIRHVILFFQGKKRELLVQLKKEMEQLAKAERFEEAAASRSQIFALEHIQDVAILTREESDFFGHPRRKDLAVNVFGRVEGYDISNISGTSAVGSMVVFVDGEAAKKEYRKFKIRTVKGANDYAMLEEVLQRRFARSFLGKKSSSTIPAEAGTHDVDDTAPLDSLLQGNDKDEQWALPDLIMVDGGLGQVNIAKRVLAERNLQIPVVGIAKGFDRKQDQLVYDHTNIELSRVVVQYKEILQRLRDEAHRFAIGYHRKVRSKRI